MMKEGARRLLNGMFIMEATVASICFACIASGLLADVLLRELFSSPIWGVQRVSVYLLIILGFLSISVAAATGVHLRPRFLDSLIPNAFERAAIRLGFVLMGIIFAFFAYLFFLMMLETREFGDEMIVLYWPLWYLQLIATYALGSTSFRYFVYGVFPSLSPPSVLS